MRQVFRLPSAVYAELRKDRGLKRVLVEPLGSSSLWEDESVMEPERLILAFAADDARMAQRFIAEIASRLNSVVRETDR